MFIILFANQKGGVGKTTLSVQTLLGLRLRGHTVSYYNLDNQSSVHETEEVENAEYAIIDTPGHLGDEFQDNCRDSDLVLIPCRASMDDMEPLQASYRLAKEAGADVRVILNEYDSRNTIDQDFMEYIAGTDMRLLCKIPHSTKFPQAQARGSSIFTLPAKSRPANDALNKMLDKIEEISNGR